METKHKPIDHEELRVENNIVLCQANKGKDWYFRNDSTCKYSYNYHTKASAMGAWKSGKIKWLYFPYQ